MIRWNFYFDEGNVTSDVNDPDEDDRLRHSAFGQQIGNLEIRSGSLNIWVNLSKVKCTTREEIPEEGNAESKSEGDV